MAEISWIKVDTGIFGNKKIKYLRGLPNGDTLTLIWIMLLTMAGQCNSGGLIFLTEDIPYSTKMLADELKVKPNIVERALKEFESLNMIERDHDFINVLGWEEHQNIEGLQKIREQNRLRKQKEREKKKTLESVTSHADVTQCHATDKEEDKDIDRECKHSLYASATCHAENDSVFEQFWKAYPKKRGKAEAKKEWESSNASEHIDDILKALSWQTKLTQWQEDNGRYIPAPANYIKDGRWEDIPPVPKVENKSYETDKVGKNSVTDWIKKYAEEDGASE